MIEKKKKKHHIKNIYWFTLQPTTCQHLIHSFPPSNSFWEVSNKFKQSCMNRELKIKWLLASCMRWFLNGGSQTLFTIFLRQLFSPSHFFLGAPSIFLISHSYPSSSLLPPLWTFTSHHHPSTQPPLRCHLLFQICARLLPQTKVVVFAYESRCTTTVSKSEAKQHGSAFDTCTFILPSKSHPIFTRVCYPRKWRRLHVLPYRVFFTFNIIIMNHRQHHHYIATTSSLHCATQPRLHNIAAHQRIYPITFVI